MTSVRILIALVACTAVAAPAQAQRIADLAPGAPSHVHPAPVLAASRDLPAALRPSAARRSHAAEARRLSVAGHAAVGALASAGAGAVASLALFALDPECRSGDSMCGLAIPALVGGGVVTGTAAGLIVGLIRNR